MVRISMETTVAVSAALALVTSALGTGTYYGLGTSRVASGVSADGSVVAGTTSSGAPYFIWQLNNPGVTTLIGGVSPGGGVGGQAKVSDDGDKICGTLGGYVASPPIPPTVVNQMAVYDVSDAAWTGLGGIGWFSGTETASGWAISGDGTKVAGLGWSPNQTNAYAAVSTNGGAPVALPWMVPGRSTRANGCDSDGSVVVGWQDNPFGFRQAAVWTDGVGQRLWLLYPTKPLGEAQACSADGNWVVGLTGPGSNSQAWLWSEDTGALLLGELNPAEGWNANATGISADGDVIVGYERPPGPATGGWGFIWTSADGMQNLTDYVVANGVTLPPGVTTLALPLNVSADGLTIVGIANNGAGYVVRLDPPAPLASCSGDTNLDNEVDTSDLLAVISAWGACPASAECSTDFNGDQEVNIADLLEVISSWGDCP